jgi:hypothetical protein
VSFIGFHKLCILFTPKSIILGACLVVIIIVSFFKVDVWLISLPFAMAKLMFDFAWDHYRYSKGMLSHHPQTGDEKADEGPRSPGLQRPAADDPMLSEFRRAMSMPKETEQKPSFPAQEPTLEQISETQGDKPTASPASTAVSQKPALFMTQRVYLSAVYDRLSGHFPTFFTALPRLPFGLIPFAFSQFILIEALTHQGWIEVFARWLHKASGGQMHPAIWIIGVLGVILCNIAGTNIGATILLTKVIRAAQLSPETTRAAGISLGVASNIVSLAHPKLLGRSNSRSLNRVP